MDCPLCGGQMVYDNTADDGTGVGVIDFYKCVMCGYYKGVPCEEEEEYYMKVRQKMRFKRFKF